MSSTYLYAGNQTSGVLDVVYKINILYNVAPYEVNSDLPSWVSSNMTYATQLENRRKRSSKACGANRNKKKRHPLCKFSDRCTTTKMKLGKYIILLVGSTDITS